MKFGNFVREEVCEAVNKRNARYSPEKRKVKVMKIYGEVVLIILIIIIVKFVKRHTRSYRGASGGVNQAA